MDNPRPEKVAVVDEVRTRLEGASATVVTEYRGLSVADLAALRKSLTAAGGDYKVFKNTLVKRAIDGSRHAPLEEFLAGPTAIAFVKGDVSAVAKALRDFSRTHSRLVVKGGMLDGALVSPSQLGELADLPPREVLLARLAGGIQAPLAQLASLLQALPRGLAYGLKALVDERGGSSSGEPGDAPAPPGSETPDAAAPDAAAPDAAAPDAAAPDAAAPDAAAPDAAVPGSETPDAAAPETEPETEPTGAEGGEAG